MIGIFVEYTPLFGKPNYEGISAEDDSKRDKELLRSKNNLGLFFLSFSVSRNLKKMFYTPQRKGDNLTVLNGVRVISMYFVVLGHSVGMMTISSAINWQSVESLITSWWVYYISLGLYSVDVFFFISAFLASYLMISKFHGKRCLNIGMIYLHRLIRLIPSLLLFTGLYIAFFQMTGSGPIWLLTTEKFLVGP